MYRLFVFISIATALATLSCTKQDNVAIKPYNGPLIEAYNIETHYTDSARLKIKVKSPKELEFENGDRLFPNGIYMEFYDEVTGEKKSYLKGKKGRYIKEKDIYIVTGNVLVQSFAEKKKLNTEELTWHPSVQKITSDDSVKIQTPDEILMGVGMTASEDFSTYKILKPTATIFLDE